MSAQHLRNTSERSSLFTFNNIHLLSMCRYTHKQVIRMLFNSDMWFFDYEGMPVSSTKDQTTNQFDLKYSKDRLHKTFLCWDRLPPRSIPGDSVLRNAATCDEAKFRELVQKCLLDKNSNDVKQMLLYEYWFRDDKPDNTWRYWLNGLSEHEIIFLLISLNADLAKHRESRDTSGIKAFDIGLLIHFNSSLALTNFLDHSFLFFIQDLTQRLSTLTLRSKITSG